MFGIFGKNKITKQNVPVTFQLFCSKSMEFVPRYKHKLDAGADVRAFRTEQIGEYIDSKQVGETSFYKDGYDLQPNETKLFGCGFCCQLTPGFSFLVCPRSGLAAKNSITVLNAPGICDAGYLGEYCVVLHNFGKEPFHISYGDRIAQIVLIRVRQADFQEGGFTLVDDRGNEGFGSTGVK